MYIEKSIKYRKILVGCEFVTIIKILQFNCYWLMDSNIFLIKSGGIGLMIFNFPRPSPMYFILFFLPLKYNNSKIEMCFIFTSKNEDAYKVLYKFYSKYFFIYES